MGLVAQLWAHQLAKKAHSVPREVMLALLVLPDSLALSKAWLNTTRTLLVKLVTTALEVLLQSIQKTEKQETSVLPGTTAHRALATPFLVLLASTRLHLGTRRRASA